MGIDYAGIAVGKSPDALLVCSPDGRVRYWNEAAVDVFGYTSEEALGQLLTELIVPKDRREEAARQERGALAQGLAVYECVRRRKDGALVHVSISVKSVTDAASSTACVLYGLKDVTRLKTLRDAQLVESKYRELLESTPDAIIIANVTGHIILANSLAEHIFGHAHSDMIGQPVEMLLPARHRAAHLGHRGSFFAQPRARAMGANQELYGLRRNGEEFPVEISLSPLDTEEGTMVMSAVRDMTTRKAERRRADQKFRDLLESAPDAMVIVDSHGTMVLVNSQAERLFGWSREELLGRKIELLVPQRYGDAHMQHRDGFFASPKTRSMGKGLDLFGRRKDGSEFPVEISLSPLVTDEGLFVSSAIRDTTDRKRFEETLHAANRMKSEFLANMSHELRTPLNGIIGFSELLVDRKVGDLNDTQREFLGDVLVNARHLLQLINDILDLSKIEAGRMLLFPEPFEVLRAVEEVRAVISHMAGPKNVALDCDCGEVGTVLLDRQRFKQVLMNLMSNAVKFTDEGGRVTVNVRARDAGTLQINVIDTGIGIAQEHLPQLFVDFHQVDSSASRQHQGTGLGLALTRRLVELQRGAIDVESELGRGSTFTVVLPHDAVAAA
jgi:protein-histidine pros-kinase